MKTNYLYVFCLAILLGITGQHLNAQINVIQEIRCNGDSTGKLGVVSPSFGTAPYSYLWSNGKNTQEIYGLKAGTYMVTITDNLGAAQNFSYTLTNPAAINILAVVTDNTNWPANNGSITVTSLGTGWVNFELRDSINHKTYLSSNGTFSNFPSGTYYLKTTDMNKCIRNDTLKIAEFAGIVVNLDIDYTACYATTAGIAVRPLSNAVPIDVDFGDTTITIIKRIPGPRPYILPGNDTVDAVSYNAWPGFHVVTVSDATNRGFRYSWMVDSISAPITFDWTQRNINCYGGNNGAIDIIARGSYENYVYQISGPNGFSTVSTSLNNLVAGRYHVVANDRNTKDSYNCVASQDIILTQPNNPLVVNLTPTDITCFGATNGLIKSHVDGGTGTKKYSWSNLATTPDIIGLATGNYTVRVTDSMGCVTVANATIGIQAVPLVTHITKDNNLCFGATNGSINIDVEWARANTLLRANIISTDTNFSILAPTANFSLHNLRKGNYNIELIDQWNCRTQESVSIDGPDRPLYIDFADPINPRCKFTADGKITIRRVEGAIAPINYTWSDGQTKKDADSLRAGRYTVTISDANGCTTIDSLVLKPGNRCMYNIVTPNGDGYNDYLDLTDLCKNLQMKATVVDQYGKIVAQLSELNPRWDPTLLGYIPTGTSSTFTVFFELFKNGQLYGSDGVSFSVLFEKK